MRPIYTFVAILGLFCLTAAANAQSQGSPGQEPIGAAWRSDEKKAKKRDTSVRTLKGTVTLPRRQARRWRSCQD